jgi:hypothetical protein
MAEQLSLMLRKLGAEGILRVEDLPALGQHKLKILTLLSDGAWHSRDEIEACVAPAREGMRRMRELREYFIIDRDRCEYGREFRYRLLIKES